MSSESKAITFEEGYRRLQEIADEVNETEVPVDRMGDLFAEGKGLDKALTDHLAEQKERIERIEKGEEVQAFRIASPSSGKSGEEAGQSEFSFNEPRQGAGGNGKDDVPF
ncbi:MAG TPA: exodeoxyribonuclease VII small subunit [Solirubrobacterales bacterium]|nr:exodeoxyribonuclease VII small subunit [Solirubrobacterales bacterium]